MPGLRSASYETKRSDRTLTGATLEMEILSQCGDSTLRDFKSSFMNHGKGSAVGQLIPVEYNRMTVSKTVSIDEPADGYMEMTEYKNSASGHLIALENKSAKECYLETMIQGTAMKQKSYRTLVSSEMHAETKDQLLSLPWRAVLLRHFEEELRTNPKIHALIAIPYARTKLRFRFARCMTGLTQGGIRLRRKKKIEGREGVPDDEYERSNVPRRSGNSVREAERRSLFHSIHARTNISAGSEYLCQDAKRRR